LKRLLNQATIACRLVPEGPILIRSGHATVSGVDMPFVRTHRNGSAQPYLPGSSLKGLLRAHAERVCRTLRDGSVCLPYLKPGGEEAHEAGQASCGLRLQRGDGDRDEAIPSFEAYRVSCAVCRLFGSTVFAGRMAVTDGYLAGAGGGGVERRDGIAVDRFTGGVAQGPFDLEVVTRGEFLWRLTVRNFERWQLGLLALVLRDLEDGMVRLGYGKSRGLGDIRNTVTTFEIAYLGANLPETLVGLWGQATETERERYGLAAEARAASLPAGRRVGLWWTHDLVGDWRVRLEESVGDLQGFLAGSPWPESIDRYVAARQRPSQAGQR
jgi:CRISPR-associated RAMP protein (TIGR02581 family)